jgi:predicted enzyme related to lactoylglutathione lyase
MSPNPIVWWELASHDAEKTVEFFRDVFGWQIDFDERVGFFKTRHDPPTVSGGGIFTLRRAKLPFLTLYIRVDDIQAMVRKVEEHGGFIVDPPLDTGEGEWICLFNEPSGVTLAMIQEAGASSA